MTEIELRTLLALLDGFKALKSTPVNVRRAVDKVWWSAATRLDEMKEREEAA